jgi:hypothetical protein
MSEFEIDFEWPVAAKYDFRPPTTEEVSAWRVRPQSLRKMPDSEWPLYLGHIVPSGKAKDHRPPEEKMRLAVKALVEYKGPPFQLVALKVVRALGTIIPDGDRLLNWYDLACDLRLMFQRAWPHPEAQLIGGLGMFLVSGKDKRPMLALRPVTLEDALKLCASRMITTGTTFNICKNCRAPFLSGGGRARNKKRGDARFCSDECRWKYHNETRRKAR